MRPLTGLRDMFFSLDPGTRSASGGEIEEGDTLPLANTAPDVPLDQILEALDNDNQAYLRAILVGAGQGLEGRGKDLGRILGSLGPINRDLEKLNTAVAERDENLSRLVHNLSILTKSVGTQDQDIMRLVTASNDTLAAIASEDPDVQNATRLLPGALGETRDALAAAKEFGDELGPAFSSLRPFARNLPELNSSTTRLAETVTPVIRDELRPFVRSAREPIPDLKAASRAPGEDGSEPRRRSRPELNHLGNMAAYNPRGKEPVGTAGRDEGYLYWAGWLSHNGVQPLRGAGRQRALPPHLLHGQLPEHHEPPHRVARRRRRRSNGCSVTGPGALFDARSALRLMQKQAPSIGRILIAAGFAISCFLLIMFLWIAFGGPVPLKAKSYRITAYFPEATQLAAESDIRIGGVSVGKVKEVSLAPPDKRIDGYDTTEAVLEIRPEFAPISEDARAILRQKTLLGETYVELTSGTEPGTESAPVSLGAAAERVRLGGRGHRGDRGGGDPGGHRHAERDADRRDLQRARSRDARRLPAMAAVRGSRRAGPLARPQRRVRQHRPVHHGRVGDPRDPQGSEGVGQGPRARYR